MKRDREPIPKTKSGFFLVQCPDCKQERVVFSNSTKDIGCRGCGRTLAQSRGGKSLIMATVLKKLS